MHAADTTTTSCSARISLTVPLRSSLRFAAAAAGLAFAANAAAALLVYDGIPTSGTGAYTTGKLRNQNRTHASIVGETGIWQDYDTSDINVNATGLSFPGGIPLTPLGGSVAMTGSAVNSTGRSLKRELVRPLAGKSFYFSALLSYDDLSAYLNGYYAVWGLTKTQIKGDSYPATDGILVGFQRTATGVDAVVRVLNTAYVIQAGVAPGTYHFVGKFVYSDSGNDTVYASVNPGAVEPSTWATNATVNVLTSAQSLAYVNVGLNTRIASKTVYVDEWRVGDSYEDVVGWSPSPPAGPPAVTDSAARVTGNTTATLSGSLSTASPPATVYACWDTTDQGTASTGAWSRVALVGTYGDAPIFFYRNLTGLTANQGYVARFWATNSLGAAWGSSVAFQTGLPAVYIADGYAQEGNAGTTPVTLGVTLDVASASNVVVNFATRADTAVAGVDYVAASGTLTIPAGLTATNLTFNVIGNTQEAFPGKRFWVDLSGPTGATLGTTSGEAGILEDDMGTRLFYDDFADGNDTANPTWMRLTNSAAWSVTGSASTGYKYKYAYTGVYGNNQAGDVNWGDCSMRVMFGNDSAGKAGGLRMRTQGSADPTGGYVFTFYQWNSYLKAGTNQLASTGSVSGMRLGQINGVTVMRPAAMRLRTVPTGTRIQCWAGFTPVFDVIDTNNYYPQGRIGLAPGDWATAYFDNVEVFAEPGPKGTVMFIR